MKKIKWIALAAIMIVATGCSTTVQQFYSDGTNVACVGAAVDAEDKEPDEVLGGGIVVVRQGACNGAVVGFTGTIYTRLWHQEGTGPYISLLCATNQRWGGPGAESIDISVSSNNTDCEGLTGGSWYAQAKGCAYFFGEEHCSDWISSPLETR